MFDHQQLCQRQHRAHFEQPHLSEATNYVSYANRNRSRWNRPYASSWNHYSSRIVLDLSLDHRGKERWITVRLKHYRLNMYWSICEEQSIEYRNYSISWRVICIAILFYLNLAKRFSIWFRYVRFENNFLADYYVGSLVKIIKKSPSEIFYAVELRFANENILDVISKDTVQTARFFELTLAFTSRPHCLVPITTPKG